MKWIVFSLLLVVSVSCFNKSEEVSNDESAQVEEINDGGAAAECVCTKEFTPVCGEDGNTYGNACEAKCSNVGIASEGECGGDDSAMGEPSEEMNDDGMDE